MSEDTSNSSPDVSWDDVISSPVPEKTVKYGGKTVLMRAPSVSVIQGAAKDPDKRSEEIAAYSVPGKPKLTPEQLFDVDLIQRTVVHDVPSREQLVKMMYGHSGLFNMLKLAAWELCGMLNPAEAIAAKGEEFFTGTPSSSN